MKEETSLKVKCTRCERTIDACDCCDQGDCTVPICSECLRVATRESLHDNFSREL